MPSVIAHVRAPAKAGLDGLKAKIGGLAQGKADWSLSEIALDDVGQAGMVVRCADLARWPDLHNALWGLGLHVVSWDVEDGSATDRGDPALAVAQKLGEK